MTPNHNTRSLDNKAETISGVLEQYAQDYYQLLRFPSKRTREIKDRKLDESLATIEKLLLEVIGKDFKAIGGNATLSIHERTIMDAKNYLKAEQRTTLKAVLYGEKK